MGKNSGCPKLIRKVLETIAVLGLHVRDFVQGSLELAFIKELSSTLDVLAIRKAFGKQRRYECFHRNLISGSKLSSLLVQIIGHCDALRVVFVVWTDPKPVEEITSSYCQGPICVTRPTTPKKLVGQAGSLRRLAKPPPKAGKLP